MRKKWNEKKRRGERKVLRWDTYRSTGDKPYGKIREAALGKRGI